MLPAEAGQQAQKRRSRAVFYVYQKVCPFPVGKEHTFSAYQEVCMSRTKKVCICAVCTALCCVLPFAFHTLVLGSALSPIHIPVLLCGLLCGWQYGLLCGVVGPVLSSVLTGIPPAVTLIPMVPELCAYGVISALLIRRIRTGRLYADLYLSMIPAMLLGRVAGGAVRAVWYLSSARSYSVALWISSYLVGTLPGAILHLILIPVLVLVLVKARLIPDRYPGKGCAHG